MYHPASLTHPGWDPTRPDRSRTTRRGLPRPTCTPPVGPCFRLSSAAPRPRCGSLWELPPPPSECPSWPDSSPSQERSLGGGGKGIRISLRRDCVRWTDEQIREQRFTQVAVCRSGDQIRVLFALTSRLKRTVFIDAHVYEGVVLLLQPHHTWRRDNVRRDELGRQWSVLQ